MYSIFVFIFYKLADSLKKINENKKQKNMKKIILNILLLFPLLGIAQAHLGISLTDLKELHNDKTFKIDYTTDGTKYASADMQYGEFTYYFSKVDGLTFRCIQIPNNMTALNAQVEIYNKKYVIVSETYWKAYLDGGGIMKINLIYDEEYKGYFFTYNF